MRVASRFRASASLRVTTCSIRTTSAAKARTFGSSDRPDPKYDLTRVRNSFAFPMYTIVSLSLCMMYTPGDLGKART